MCPPPRPRGTEDFFVPASPADQEREHAMAPKVIMTDADVRRAITRIAHEIVENTRGTSDLVLVGMYTRGVPLAHRIAEAIKSFEGESVPVGALDTGPYRDDLPK